MNTTTTPPPPDVVPGRRGVSQSIEDVLQWMREHDHVRVHPTGSAALARHVADSVERFRRILSYHPGGPGSRAYYGCEEALVPASELRDAEETAPEGLQCRYGLLIAPTGRKAGRRQIWRDYRWDADRWGRTWVAGAEWVMNNSDEVPSLLRVHPHYTKRGWEVRWYRARKSTGQLVTSPRGETYHLSSSATPEQAVRTARQAFRRRRQERVLADRATRAGWVTEDAARLLGACDPGIDAARREIAQVLRDRGDRVGDLRGCAVRLALLHDVRPEWASLIERASYA